MTYFAPVVNSSGLSIPKYNDILSYYIQSAQTIYGTNIYLANDSADYQLLSTIALSAFDAMNSAQLAYNSFSATTAIGAAQDSLYRINGLDRKIPSYSTCEVYLTGNASLTITNGKMIDINNNVWDLPITVVLDVTGHATVTATCETVGAITALPSNINKIYTPTRGWTSATNLVAAITGQPVETHAQFRARQTISTQLPSQSMLSGTIGGIATISGVTRYSVLENPTGSPATDPNGDNLPAHSITAIVEGGTDTNVATVIYNNKSIGCYTNGTTTINVPDPIYGFVTPINFYRPTYVPIYATIGVHILPGYTGAVTPQIQNAINNYLNGLQIGEGLTISALYGAALSVMPNLAIPIFSIRSLVAGTSFGGQSTTDIPILFNGVTQGILTNVVVNLI
jgi:uncharacterized phage protein gp47/JayE